MKVHFIAVGGSAMHSLALMLHSLGHEVTGSDDEIYDPARSKLATAGILPEKEGWFPAKITPDLDVVILGMHARPTNPELEEALKRGIPVQSFPEFIYHQSKDKKRVVVAGSHGKTTITAMIIHVLTAAGIDCDYLLGASLPGFANSVKLSKAPLIIIEGDEYLSSPVDRRSKFLHFKPHVTIITGIAWDHYNVFPQFEDYLGTFQAYINTLPSNAQVIYFQEDINLDKIVGSRRDIQALPYTAHAHIMENGRMYLEPMHTKVQVFGRHNAANLEAARQVCLGLGVSEFSFYRHIASFEGAAKRLQLLAKGEKGSALYLDYAHAPSKVRATVQALKDLYPAHQVVACFELHTFSSLNKSFIPNYKDTLLPADEAIVFFSPHTLEMKRLPNLDHNYLQEAFNHPKLLIVNSKEELEQFLFNKDWEKKVLLLMSSGRFDGLNLQKLSNLLKNC